jgi:hypothetical protein
MANPEHVEIVRQGKDAIERWQSVNPKAPLDLSGADVFGANLAEANLTEANLRGVNLFGADLCGADLSRAALCQTTFLDTALNQTQFWQATLLRSALADCDLSGALGLESANHLGPSSIGLDTIVKSGGNIPEVFLRGCGGPESIITFVRSLVAQPIQFYTCFISYAHLDQAFADRLYADLQAKGVRCWYYPESATMGRRVWEDIDRSIKVYDKLVVICSEVSLNRPAVIREIVKSLEKEDAGGNSKLTDPYVLFPIRIDNYVFDGWEHHRKSDVTGRNIGDFLGWDSDNDKYLNSLNRLLHALDPKSWPAVG